MRVLCSTEFLWGAELSETVRLLSKLGCEGFIISTEPPHYLPSMMHRSSILSLKSVLASIDTVVVVRSPETDVNLFSSNPYISEASIKSIEEAGKLAKILNADFTVIRPSSKPFSGNPVIAARKLQVLASRIGRDHYMAFELLGEGSANIADNLLDPRLGIIYVHGKSPHDLLNHRKLVGISMYVMEGKPPRKVIPGLKGETPYLIIYPSRRHLYDTKELRRIIIGTKSWRDSLI